MNSNLFQTGFTTSGTPLFGGVWTHWAQNGFPIELSYVTLRNHGALVDWLEVILDASRTNNLPALWEQMTTFLPAEELKQIKAKASLVFSSGKADELWAQKRAAA